MKNIYKCFVYIRVSVKLNKPLKNISVARLTLFLFTLWKRSSSINLFVRHSHTHNRFFFSTQQFSYHVGKSQKYTSLSFFCISFTSKVFNLKVVRLSVSLFVYLYVYVFLFVFFLSITSLPRTICSCLFCL